MKVVTSLIVILFSVIAAFEDQTSEEHNEDYNEYPRYNFEYGVHDPSTKDIKKHWEKRDGDSVKGSYRFIQPDGSLRIVEYNSDDKNGFNAFVKFEDRDKHPLETEIEGESYEAPVQTENLQDTSDFNFLPEENTPISSPHAVSAEKENEESLYSSQRNKSIHAYHGSGREQGQGKGYEVKENPESNEYIEEELD